jgi:hypothetical protein
MVSTNTTVVDGRELRIDGTKYVMKLIYSTTVYYPGRLGVIVMLIGAVDYSRNMRK